MKRRWIIVAELALLLALGLWALLSLRQGSRLPADAIEIKAAIPGTRQIYLAQDPAGGLRYTITNRDGTIETLNPDGFARKLYATQRKLGWAAKVCNVTSVWGVLWVAFAMVVGQGLFTGRMVVQWLASEKHKRSVVPTAFWWMSLVGSTVLLVYFVWRRDVVGVVGQVFGWSIYIRNLLLIYGHQPPPPAGVDPGPEPELGK